MPWGPPSLSHVGMDDRECAPEVASLPARQGLSAAAKQPGRLLVRGWGSLAQKRPACPCTSILAIWVPPGFPALPWWHTEHWEQADENHPRPHWTHFAASEPKPGACGCTRTLYKVESGLQGSLWLFLLFVSRVSGLPHLSSGTVWSAAALPAPSSLSRSWVFFKSNALRPVGQCSNFPDSLMNFFSHLVFVNYLFIHFYFLKGNYLAQSVNRFAVEKPCCWRHLTISLSL